MASAWLACTKFERASQAQIVDLSHDPDFYAVSDRYVPGLEIEDGEIGFHFGRKVRVLIAEKKMF